MIDHAFIQEEGGGQLRHEEKLVVEGLQLRGIPFELYTEKRILRRQLPLTETSLVVGDMPCTYGAMKQLGIPIPEANTYPASLVGFMHRRTWHSTVGQLRTDVSDGAGRAIFAKPTNRQKVFTGAVFADLADLYWLHKVSHRQPIICAESVRWLTEYRVYVCEGAILSVDFYDGDASIKPDLERVEAAIRRLTDAGEAYAGYAIDFGVLSSGETALVEMNDGFSVGAYSIGSDDYTRMILARWDQLLGNTGKAS
jgi:hypothetical protein